MKNVHVVLKKKKKKKKKGFIEKTGSLFNVKSKFTDEIMSVPSLKLGFDFFVPFFFFFPARGGAIGNAVMPSEFR